MRKTKIVCTIGPATDDDAIMRQIMQAGMNVARFNFSHGDYEMHKKRFEQVVRIREELDLPIATLMDTRGPEIRLGRFVDDKPVTIHSGDTYTLTTKDVLCTNEIGSISFKNLPHDVKTGTHILINDGVIEMEVTKLRPQTLSARLFTAVCFLTTRELMFQAYSFRCRISVRATETTWNLAQKWAMILLQQVSCGRLLILII